MPESLKGAAEPAKARLLDDAEIEEMRVKAEVDAMKGKEAEDEDDDEED